MAIRVECAQCGSTFTVPDSRAGQTGRCKCGGMVTVPAAPTPAPAPAPAPRPAPRPAATAADDEPALARMAENIAEARSRGPAPAAQVNDPNMQLCRHCGMATRKDIPSCEWCGQALVERPTQKGFDAAGGYTGAQPSPPIVTVVVRVVAIIYAVLNVLGGILVVAGMLLAGAFLAKMGLGGGAGAGAGLLVGFAIVIGLVCLAFGGLWCWVNTAVANAQSAGWWAYTVLACLAVVGMVIGMLSAGASAMSSPGMAAMAGTPGGAAMAESMARVQMIRMVSLLINSIHIPILVFWFMRPVREWFGISQPR